MRIPVLIVLALSFLGLNAQVEKEVFESFKLQEKREVSYYYPEDYDPTNKYPLIVVLDADYLFDLVVANVKFYSQNDRMPSSIVVGIHQSENEVRYDDCAFNEGTGLPTEKGSQFYEFIGTEILPYLETNYNIAPFKMFVGYDITANFGNYFLFKERSLFNAYVMVSPYLAPDMETRVPERMADLDQILFYNLILENEKSKYRDLVVQMANGIEAVSKETLYSYFDEYEDTDHVSVVAASIGKAFDNVFNFYRPISPKEYKEKILTDDGTAYSYLENKYGMIKSLMGFDKKVELNDVMAIYSACLKKEDYESLKPLAALCKKEFEGTMLGFYFEGERFENLGQPKKAIKAYEKAFLMEPIDFLDKDVALQKIEAIKADFGY